MNNWTEQLAVLVPLLSAVVAWFVNERSKRAWEEYTRKEQHYSALLHALRGFYQSSGSKEQRDEFLVQVNFCWLYCPDNVIRKAYTFLDSVRESSPTGPVEGQAALGELVVAIRRDMLSRRIVKSTELRADDFRAFASR